MRSTDIRQSVYLSLVRPLFGYATQIWAPQSIELISRIKRTQRRATKYILKLPFPAQFLTWTDLNLLICFH